MNRRVVSRTRARGTRRARCRGSARGCAHSCPSGRAHHFRTCSKSTPGPTVLSSGCVRWRHDDVLPGTSRRDRLARRSPVRGQFGCPADAPGLGSAALGAWAVERASTPSWHRRSAARGVRPHRRSRRPGSRCASTTGSSRSTSATARDSPRLNWPSGFPTSGRRSAGRRRRTLPRRRARPRRHRPGAPGLRRARRGVPRRARADRRARDAHQAALLRTGRHGARRLPRPAARARQLQHHHDRLPWATESQLTSHPRIRLLGFDVPPGRAAT